MKYKWQLLVLVACLAASVFETANARVTRFVVEHRDPLANGARWGSAGPYEKLLGTVYFEVDPKDPLNAVIVNLDKAPRNPRGRVEFSSPFVILKPANMALGNRKIWYGVNNRGVCAELPFHAFPLPGRERACNPTSIEDVGASNNLLREGFVWVDAGWHGDGVTPADRSKLFPSFPVARKADGSSIVGPNRLEFQTETATFTLPFIRGFRPYEAADTRTSQATLTVRDQPDGPRIQIPADRWAFASCPKGPAHQAPSRTDVCLFDGFAPRKIYELIYPAKDPIVMGLAYAVTRDIGSFLRHQARDDVGNPNPLAMSEKSVGIRRAYVSGSSSTGMYLREFLYLGFNEDEAHRQVFDGAAIYSAGSHRLFANVQFAHPTFFSGQDQHHDYTSNSIPPFTFAVTTDPITGIKDGILKRPATDPYVLQVDEETAFWQWKASLNVVDSLGKPLPVPENVRLYHLNGFGHIMAAGLLAAPSKDSATCTHLTQGNATTSSRSAMPRALVKILDDWADRGIAPPATSYPMIQNETLVSLAEYRKGFPKIPGFEPPTAMNELMPLDFGSEFGPAGGIQSLQPPRVHGSKYTLFVPQAGPNGDAVAGIDALWTRVPLGTNVGWNVQKAPRESDLCSLSGSYVPLAETKAERMAKADPRLSLEERYTDHAGFVAAVRKASAALVFQRFMLPEDADVLIEAAEDSDVLKAPELRVGLTVQNGSSCAIQWITALMR